VRVSGFVRVIALASLVVVVLLMTHVALIEVGREVVTIHVPRAGASTLSRRLWIVDDGASSWLHSAGADWREALAGNPVVELERGGTTRRFRATPVPGPHPALHRLLREKYGLVDRWVRFLGPDDDAVLAVRLDPL
jgi:hypothetical protein